MEKKNDIVVIVRENLGAIFGDSVGAIDPNKAPRGPKGRVEMYEVLNGEKKLIFEKNNLVVYLGREWVNEKIFNVDNPNITPLKEEWICWLGLGSGGTVFGDPFDPAPPSSTNTDLTTPVMINPTDNINCGDLRVDGYYKHKLDEVAYEQDVNNSNSYLITRVQIIIGQNDAIGTMISEAGLFTASDDSGGYSGDFHLFARVTFPSIYKDSSRQLIFIWYIYC